MSIRKTIFKNELNFILEKHKACEIDKDKIVHSLFENPFEVSKQYILKKEINDSEELREKLERTECEKELIGAISSLFLVQDDLELPIDIKKLFLSNEKVGVLVGAGVSKLLNFPLWKELGDMAIKYLYEKTRINYFEYQKIQSEMIDPKQKITVFDNLIPRNTEEGKEFYQKAFNNPDDYKNPYELLVNIDWIKLTSNIDKEFLKALERNFQWTPVTLEEASDADSPKIVKTAKIISTNFDSTNVDYDTIYHIHGSIDELNGTILTTKDYIQAYYEHKSGLREFLRNIFQEYTILFMGYGLEEFSILEHIIGGSKEHYVLFGTYLNEMNLFRLKQEYFKTLNITPIRYYLDFNGYYRLNSVLTSWIQQINEARDAAYYERVREIDEVLD